MQKNMKIEQIYTGCLSQGAYYISSGNEAIIIDPLREVNGYIQKSAKDGATIKYILETHFHADFVSGHITLAEKTGATIVFGPTANPSFPCHIAKDGEVLKIGNITIEVMHTPGHTMESTCYLLKDENGKIHSLFTGDTLFLGDVGRPDLAQKAETITQEDLASLLYDSLRNKIMVLPDETIIYPGHGAGSACGKHMMKETVDTLKNQKSVNYALRADMTKEEFIKEVTEGLLPPAKYFPMNVKMNKEGYEDIDEIIEDGTKALDPETFQRIAEAHEAIILDVRSPKDFAEGHIPSSIFIGIDGSFAPWVGALIVDVQQPLLLVTPEGREEETVTRLARVGFDKTLGYLKGGIAAWIQSGKAIDTVTSVTSDALAVRLKDNPDTIIVDVRNTNEYLSEHVIGAINTPLDFINEHMASFPKDKPFYIHCAGGYRSMIANSVLKARGYHEMIDISGGFKAISNTNIPKSDFVCPSTL